ncbi:MAG TPA: hypothetical protein VFA81_13270 [Burkholderiales bacterium]|nr:hypothetical protein [Burkholderiales bacterium]
MNKITGSVETTQGCLVSSSELPELCAGKETEIQSFLDMVRSSVEHAQRALEEKIRRNYGNRSRITLTLHIDV